MITALNSNTMIAPNYWVDHVTGNDYFLTVQYYEQGKPAIHNLVDLTNIPLRAANLKQPTTLDTVVKLETLQTPTEVDHYQIQRVSDVYVTPASEDLGGVSTKIEKLIQKLHYPANIRINLRGMVDGMNQSFKSFAFGFTLSFILLLLILVAQFRSFVDPFLIMLAIPMGFIGVLIILPLTHTTLNVMSLMGILMLIGIADSNSILIVDFAHKLEEQGLSPADAVVTACRVRLRPILMTSFATIIGMIPLAMKLGTGAEQYTPMARAIIGGLASSVLLTIFIVPAAYVLVYRKQASPRANGERGWSGWSGRAAGMIARRVAWSCAVAALLCAGYGVAQDAPPMKLTLRQAEDLALKNHPQVLAAQALSSAAGEQVKEARSAYYPALNADLTASQGNSGSRIGAGALVASRSSTVRVKASRCHSSSRISGGRATSWPVRSSSTRHRSEITRQPVTMCCSP